MIHQPDRPLTNADNFCRACGENFSSERAFERHRTGTHEYTYSEGARMDPPREDGRRCKTTVELRREGWRVNSRGRWTPERPWAGPPKEGPTTT